MNSLEDMDQNYLDQIYSQIKNNMIAIKTLYGINVSQNVITQLSKMLAFLVSRIINIKTSL